MTRCAFSLWGVLVCSVGSIAPSNKAYEPGGVAPPLTRVLQPETMRETDLVSSTDSQREETLPLPEPSSFAVQENMTASTAESSTTRTFQATMSRQEAFSQIKQQLFSNLRTAQKQYAAAKRRMNELKKVSVELQQEKRAYKSQKKIQETISETNEEKIAAAEAFAKMEAAEKVVAYSKKEGFDFQRFGDRTQREMEITLAAKGVLERRLTELGPQLTAASEELATTKMKLRSLRAAQAESEERLAPLACENGSMASELEQLRASEGQARAELTELREASALERAHLLQEAGSWKEFAKRNQVEMEMYVGKKVAQFGQAVAALNDVQQEPFPLKLTAVGVAT